MRRILFIIIVLSLHIGCNKEETDNKDDSAKTPSPTDYIIAGQYDSTIWTFIDIVPNIYPTIYSRTNNNHTRKGYDSLDLFGDSDFDLGCREYWSEWPNNELQRWEYSLNFYITNLNKNKISLAGPFFYGDTINAGSLWGKDSIHTYDYYKGHCYICNWMDDTCKVYLGVRYIDNYDSIYSWIQINYSGEFAEYAYNRKAQ